MKFHFIIHEEFEGAGYFYQWVKDRGYHYTESRLYLGESLPNFEDFDALVIFGGPQSPSTSKDECAHFDSEAEQNLIRNAINQKCIVIGVCLGAQLIGEALGAKTEPSPYYEIGYFPIRLTQEGREDRFFESFELTELVGHWHHDMPGLTENSKVIAYSSACPRQIIKYDEYVYGFQCHLEFIKGEINGLIENNKNSLSENNGHLFVESEELIKNTSTLRMNQLLGSFLGKIEEAYKEDFLDLEKVG